MLKPKYLERLPAAMVELYSQVEQDILCSMARRLAAFDDLIPAAQWQYRKLIEMGNHHSYVVKALGALTGKTEAEIQQLIRRSGQAALRFDTAVYRMAGLDPPSLAASERLQAVMQEGLRSTMGLFENLTHTTANTSTKQLERSLDRAWLQVSSGAFSHQEAVRMAVQELAKSGLSAVEYPSGHIDAVDVAVRRCTLTGVNQTALKLQDALAEEMGCDLVEVTAHAGARTGVGIADHAGWQGKVYSRSGRHAKYPSLVEKTGYGSGAGLGGWNCRHSFFPFIEGASERAYTDAELKELNAPKYTYNGKKLTEYEATQRQRYLERNIRRWKREKLAMEAAGQDSGEAAARLKKWQDTQKDFLEQTGLKRQYDREWVAADNGVLKRAEQIKANEQAAFEKMQATIGRKAPKSLAEFTEIKYTDKERWRQLMENQRLFAKIENNASYSSDYKNKLKETYQFFLDSGFEFREHALNRVLGQKSGKDKFWFTKEQLLAILKQPGNYRQSDGKIVRFYDGIAAVSAEDTGEIISIVVRSTPRKDWETL